MLQLRPSCEHCTRALPPDSTEARICTYECTFCARCVEDVLHDVCPNCGGNFTPRPIRPATTWLPGTGLNAHPASTKAVHKTVDADAHAALTERQQGLPPERR